MDGNSQVGGRKIAIWRKRCPRCDAPTGGIIGSANGQPDLWRCTNGHRAEVEWVPTLLGHDEPILHMIA